FGSGLNRLPDPLRNAILNNRGTMTTNNDKIHAFGRSLAEEAAGQGLTADRLSAARNRFEDGQISAGGTVQVTGTPTQSELRSLANRGIQAVYNSDTGAVTPISHLADKSILAENNLIRKLSDASRDSSKHVDGVNAGLVHEQAAGHGADQ